MKWINIFKNWIQKKKSNFFWNYPDEYLAAIILDEVNGQVYGEVKKGLALLDGIPNPSTGYSYLDVVKVIGPIGKQMFRDEQIHEYKAVEIYKPSNIPTFTFKAIIPKSNDYFKFLDWFEKNGKKARLQWFPKENNTSWRIGYCTADNLKQATILLNDFMKLDSSIKIVDIADVDYKKNINTRKKWKHLKTILDGEKFELEGVNIWDYDWKVVNDKIKVIDPFFTREYEFTKYRIVLSDKNIEFVAGEFSNCVWGIYQEKNIRNNKNQ